VVEGADDGPFACSLLACRVEYPGDQRLAVGVPEPEYFTGYLDQVGVKLTLVPLVEYISHLIICECSGAEHQVISFAYQLHVTIFDAVMCHLDEVAGAVVANPGDAGSAVRSPGRDGMENILHMRPCLPGAAGHHRRAEQRAFFTSRNPCTDIKEALAFNIGSSPDGVRKMRVTSLYDYITLVEQRDQQFNEVVHRLACLYHEHYFSRPAEA